MDAALTQGVHAGLCAHTLQLGAACAGHELGNLTKVDAARQVHLARMDLQNLKPRVLVGCWELNLAVNPAWPEKRRVQDVDAVGRHDDLDILCCLKTVELVEQLEHGALHLAVAAPM